MKNSKNLRGYIGIIIKDKRQDEDTVYRMMHQALHAYSDQMRMYDISESIIQAIIMIVLPTMS